VNGLSTKLARDTDPSGDTTEDEEEKDRQSCTCGKLQHEKRTDGIVARRRKDYVELERSVEVCLLNPGQG